MRLKLILATGLVICGLFTSCNFASPLGPGGGESECGEGAACAPRANKPVPDVVGLPLKKACKLMLQPPYNGGGIRTVVKGGDERPGTVLNMDDEPGTKGSVGQILMIHVAGPVDMDHLPLGCVSRIPGDY